jgi:hypothetical protein
MVVDHPKVTTIADRPSIEIWAGVKDGNACTKAPTINAKDAQNLCIELRN